MNSVGGLVSIQLYGRRRRIFPKKRFTNVEICLTFVDHCLLDFWWNLWFAKNRPNFSLVIWSKVIIIELLLHLLLSLTYVQYMIVHTLVYNVILSWFSLCLNVKNTVNVELTGELPWLSFRSLSHPILDPSSGAWSVENIYTNTALGQRSE